MTAPRARDLPYVKGCYESWAKWCYGARRVQEVSQTGRLIQDVHGALCTDFLKDIWEGRVHPKSCEKCGGKGKVDLEGIHRSVPRVCPVCENKRQVVDGKVRHDLPTLFCGNQCFRCRGVGFVVVRLFEANPATIQSTRHVGAKPPPDTCLLLDELVTGWMGLDDTRWFAKVIRAEFFWNGDQDDKARELRVSVSFFEKRIRHAYYLTEQMLDEKMPRDVLTRTVF